MFGSNLKNIYDMNILNDMNFIHYHELNNISECNLLQVVLNPSELAKNINSHHSPIIHKCMNTRRDMEKYITFESYYIVYAVTR